MSYIVISPGSATTTTTNNPTSNTFSSLQIKIQSVLNGTANNSNKKETMDLKTTKVIKPIIFKNFSDIESKLNVGDLYYVVGGIDISHNNSHSVRRIKSILTEIYDLSNCISFEDISISSKYLFLYKGIEYNNNVSLDVQSNTAKVTNDNSLVHIVFYNIEENHLLKIAPMFLSSEKEFFIVFAASDFKKEPVNKEEESVVEKQEDYDLSNKKNIIDVTKEAPQSNVDNITKHINSMSKTNAGPPKGLITGIVQNYYSTGTEDNRNDHH